MKDLMGRLIFFFLCFISYISLSHGYDPLDPHGNVTIKWDLLSSTPGSNTVSVSIFNLQLYRHVEAPGWKLHWNWTGNEVIWNMFGAEATEQGDCSAFKSDSRPHCCKKLPVIVDLLPGAPYNIQTTNCCKGGVLSSMKQDPSKSVSTFRMGVGSVDSNYSQLIMPNNFSLGIPGYTCSDPFKVPPSRFREPGSRRWTQVLGTWNVTCTYSQSVESPSPTCCFSMSAFYSDRIVPCPKCSCGCEGQPGGTKCLKYGQAPLSYLQQVHDPTEAASPLVRCTQHMCPIRVHWHIKESYREYWRVKISITNLNIVKNYTEWNLVVLHPNLKSLTQVFSFNYAPLNQYGNINDTGMFWGVKFFNDMLLQDGTNGNVQSEILLRKDAGEFSFREGWAFPRKISFNGAQCVMPEPVDYPRLPNKGNILVSLTSLSLFCYCFLLLVTMS